MAHCEVMTADICWSYIFVASPVIPKIRKESTSKISESIFAPAALSPGSPPVNRFHNAVDRDLLNRLADIQNVEKMFGFVPVLFASRDMQDISMHIT